MIGTKLAVDACHDILLLKLQLAVATYRRDLAIQIMHESDGIPKSRISDKLRGALALGDAEHAGLTEAQIEGLGVSEWAVRLVFDKAKQQVDNQA